MSKYKLHFSLARIDDDNEFVTHEVGKFDVTLPLENVEQLTALMFQEARTQLNGMVATDPDAEISSSNPPLLPTPSSQAREKDNAA